MKPSAKLKILQIHNQYQFRGGEDSVAEAESSMLTSHGHEVIRYQKTNDDLKKYSLFAKGALIWKTTWSQKSYDEISELCRTQRPDVAHFHNTLPLITPSGYHACKDNGVAVIQTLHNFRLICPGALLFRDGGVCEKCVSKESFAPALLYGCYRNSRIQTYAVSRMIEKHKAMGTWKNTVDRYIALTEFSKQKYVAGGLPENKISVKPNFVPDVKIESSNDGFALYLGRLSKEKGVETILKAWEHIDGNRKLIVAGDGPLGKNLCDKYGSSTSIEFTGELNYEQASSLLSSCSFIIVASVWYENFPMTILEAFRAGKAVVASRIGNLANIITDGKTGILFNPDNPSDLAQKLNRAFKETDKTELMGGNAREEYEAKYTPAKNYDALTNIYKEAIDEQ